MISNNFEDYEVIQILGTTTYKVQNTNNGNIFLWKAITFKKPSEIDTIVKKIEEQKVEVHKNLLKIHDYIIKEDTGVIYVITEHLSNGNLNCIVQKCVNENKYLHENFLWKVLYQIANILRSSVVTYLDLNNIFIDTDFSIKMFKENVMEKVKFSSIGQIMYYLSTSHHYRENADIPDYYTNEYKEIIKFILSATYSTKEIVDAILCHPTILYKFNEIPQMYVQNPETTAVAENKSNHETEDDYKVRLKNLRNRERALIIQEDKLLLKEYELRRREKKLAIMDRTVKEKLLHAEVYLKRCREIKPSSSKKYEDLDSTVSAACESFVDFTSKKLNPNNIKKPTNFTRSLSQHRVQFKGHSPLKDKFGKTSKCNNDGVDVSNTNVSSKKKLELFSTLNKSKKPLSDQNVLSEKEMQGYRPISWCVEAKQQAFELLRFMNEKENLTVKHTYL